MKKPDFIKNNLVKLQEITELIKKGEKLKWVYYEKAEVLLKLLLKKKYKIDGQLAIVDGCVFALDIGRKDQHKRGSFLIEMNELTPESNTERKNKHKMGFK